jgi:SAM-dependent methyltransferase
MDIAEFYAVNSSYYDGDYDLTRKTADVDFYVELAKEIGPRLLELGCGTGRTLVPTARVGTRVHGVEISAPMLERCRARLAAEPPAVRERVELTLGDIGTVSLGETFDLVTAPFRVVQHLVGRDEQRRWLRNVARHLAPGGSLVFDVFQPMYQYLAIAGSGLDLERVDPVSGNTIRRFTRVEPRPAAQLVDMEFRWVVTTPGGAQVSEETGSYSWRWFTRAELENLLELEGFRVTDYWGGFDRRPYGEDATDQVVRAVRA